MNLHQKLYRYFEQYKDDWHSSAALQRMSWIDSHGKTASPSNISRRLRELENGDHYQKETGSLIAVKYDRSGNAHYRYIPKEWRDRYIPSSERSHRTSNVMWASRNEHAALLTSTNA